MKLRVNSYVHNGRKFIKQHKDHNVKSFKLTSKVSAIRRSKA